MLLRKRDGGGCRDSSKIRIALEFSFFRFTEFSVTRFQRVRASPALLCEVSPPTKNLVLLQEGRPVAPYEGISEGNLQGDDLSCLRGGLSSTSPDYTFTRF